MKKTRIYSLVIIISACLIVISTSCKNDLKNKTSDEPEVYGEISLDTASALQRYDLHGKVKHCEIFHSSYWSIVGGTSVGDSTDYSKMQALTFNETGVLIKDIHFSGNKMFRDWTFNPYGEITEVKFYDTKGNFVSKVTRTYDKYHRKISERKYDKDGVIMYSTDYLYDDNKKTMCQKSFNDVKKLIEQYDYDYGKRKCVHSEFEEEKLVRKTYSLLDIKGYVVNSLVYNADSMLLGKETFSYFDNGKVKNHLIYFADTVTLAEEYTYNVKEEVICHIKYDMGNNIISETYTKYANDNKTVIEETKKEKNMDGYIQKCSHTYEYNDKGLLVKETNICTCDESKYGDEETTITYEYSDFDKYGNWTKKKEIEKNVSWSDVIYYSSKQHITSYNYNYYKRKIDYYE